MKAPKRRQRKKPADVLAGSVLLWLSALLGAFRRFDVDMLLLRYSRMLLRISRGYKLTVHGTAIPNNGRAFWFGHDVSPWGSFDPLFVTLSGSVSRTAGELIAPISKMQIGGIPQMAHLSRGALTFWLTGSLEGGRIDMRLLPLQIVSTVCGLLLIGRRCHFEHNRVRMQHFSFANSGN